MYTPNQKVKSLGLNMNCKEVVVKSTFVRYLLVNEVKVYEGGKNGTTILDCVISDGGFNMMMDSRKLF